MEDKTEKNIRLTIAYDGTGYYGWQRQPDKKTIQGVVEEKIGIMVGDKVSLIASGRTDAGVHALNQVANFKVCSNITPYSFFKGLNSLLPDSILIKEARYMPATFHSRYDTKSKVYEYRVYSDKLESPFFRHYAWHISRYLDLEPMKECMEIIRGIHDFSVFCSDGDNKNDNIRTVINAEIIPRGPHWLYFVFEADGFLRHMVRNIMGAIIMAGLSEIRVDYFKDILESKYRRKAGIKAPPGGLYLKRVKY
jgi:tRNA pseudouridine38-40 synthase